MGRILARAALFAVAIAVLTAWTGGSQAGGSKKVYKSPQDVFAAAKTAAQNEDIKGFLGCITADSRDTMAGGLVFVGMLMKGFAKLAKDEEKKAAMQKLDAVFEKYGLTEENLKKKDKDDKKLNLNDPEQMKAAMKKFAALIKDRDGFILDFFEAMPKKDKKQRNPFEDMVGKNPTLKDVQIDGDSAKGVLVGTKDDTEVRKPLEFKKEGGGWKIDMPLPDKKGPAVKKGTP